MDGDRNERTAEVVPVALRQARAVQARNVGRKKEETRPALFVAPLLRGADRRSAPVPTHRYARRHWQGQSQRSALPGGGTACCRPR